MVQKEEIKFIPLVWRFVQNYFALNKLNPKTETNYKSFVKSIQEFFTETGRPDILVTEIDMFVADEMLLFLRKRGGLTNASRSIEICKRTLEFARKRHIIAVNELLDFKTGRDKAKEVVHLEQNELQKFIYPQLFNKELEIALDIYVFQANTGMSFGDLWSYRIVTDHIGTWIFNRRCKGAGNQYWVPLSEDAKRIHEKYLGQLPRINLVTYNRKLKQAAEQENIAKNLSSHTARKTFATLKYEKGWSLEAIADMMGISVAVLIKHYIRKSRKRLENEVLAMQEKTKPVEIGVVLKIV